MPKETLAAVIFSSVLVLLALTPVHAQPISVTDCLPPYITASGTYVLQNDISATYDDFPNCFHVDASNVTIDLNGHTITRLKSSDPYCTTPGDGDCGSAIITTFTNNLHNITVLGPGKIEGFGSAVLYQTVTKGSITNVFSENNYSGINVHASSSKITVEENVVLGSSTVGIEAADSEKNTVAKNEAIGNNQGILLFNTEDTDVTGNNATRNDYGIRLRGSVPMSPNEVTENIAVGNSADIQELTVGLGTYKDNFCEFGEGCPNFPDLKISHQ